MRKIVFLICVGMALLFMVSCGNDVTVQSQQNYLQVPAEKVDEAAEIGDGPITLIYATVNPNMIMTQWIELYNVSQQDVRIEVKQYTARNLEDAIARLNADIVVGKVPDLLDLSDINALVYADKGLLCDLYSFLDEEAEMGREDFLQGVLGLYEKNDKLYGISAGCNIETLLGKHEEVGERALWTKEKMENLVQKRTLQPLVIDNLGAMGLLRMFMQFDMKEYIDDAGNAMFGGEDFIHLLELCKKMDGDAAEGNLEDMLEKGDLLFHRAYISNLEEYTEAVDMFRGASVEVVGFPTAHGGKSFAYPFLPTGIMTASTHEREAWQFLRTILMEDFQKQRVHFNFPIRKDVLEKQFDAAIHPVDNDWKQIGESRAPTQEDAVCMKDVLNAIGGMFAHDADIWKIIEEEAAAYFDGKKSVEETAKIIQNRVQMYIWETGL